MLNLRPPATVSVPSFAANASLSAAVDELEGDLAAETAARIAADDALDGDLAAETAARLSLSQKSALTGAVTTGTSVAYVTDTGVGTPTVASGARINVLFHVTNGLNPTLEITNNAAAALQAANGSAIPEGSLQTGKLYEFVRRAGAWRAASPYQELTEEESRAESAEAALLQFPERPGEEPGHFTAATTGEMLSTGKLSTALSAVDSDGKVVRITGAAIVSTRAAYRVETGRTYRLRFVVRRRTNTTDPANDAVLLRIRWLTSTKDGVVSGGITTLESLTSLDTGDGRVEHSFLISTAGGDDITVPPAGTVYARPLVQTFGTVPVTDIEIIQWTDLTEGIAYSPDLTTLSATVAGLVSLDIGDRLDALEALAAGSEIARFKDVATAEASMIPAPVDFIEILSPDYRIYERVVSGGDFTSLDGAGWLTFFGGFADEAAARAISTATSSLSEMMSVRRVHDALNAFDYRNPIFYLEGSGDPGDAVSDTAGLVALLLQLAGESLTDSANLPTHPAYITVDLPAGRPWYNLIGRVIDGKGRRVYLTDEIDVSKLYGVKLQNFCFLPVDSGNWDSTKSLLNVKTQTGTDFEPAQLFGLWLDNCVFSSCDETGAALCNGFDVITGTRHIRVTNCIFWGYDIIADGWGARFQGGIEHEFNWNLCYGPLGMATASPVSPNSATGLIFAAGDSEIVGNKIFRSACGMDLGGVGLQVSLNHFHGFADAGDAPAVRISKSATAFINIHDNYFDSGLLRIEGSPRNVSVKDNRWVPNVINSTPALTKLIQIVASAPDEELLDLVITDNEAQVGTQVDSSSAGLYENFIELVQEGGNYFSNHRFAWVGDNRIRSSSSAPAGTWPNSTYGNIIIDVTAADFDGGTTVLLDLSKYVFMWWADEAPFNVVSFSAMGNDGVARAANYVWGGASGELAITFGAAFTGRICLAFEFGIQSRVIDSDYIRKAEEPDDILGAKLKAWWKASDHGGANMTDDGAGVISAWVDAIGSMSLTASTTARPTWAATSFNGIYPGVTFDGSANTMASTSLGTLPTGSTPGEIWIIFQSLGAGAASDRVVAYGGISGNDARAFTLLSTNHDVPRVNNGTTGGSNSLAGAKSPCMVGGLWSGTTMQGWINRRAMSDGAVTVATLNTGATRFRLGARNLNSADLFCSCVVSDVFVTTELTETERGRLRTWAAHARGVAM